MNLGLRFVKNSQSMKWKEEAKGNMILETTTLDIVGIME